MSRIDNAENVGHIDDLNFYSLFSKSIKLFNIPFPAADDETAVKIVVEKAAAATDAALTYGMLNDDLVLHCIGFFNYSNGLVNSFLDYEVEVDLKSRLLSIRKDLHSYVQKVGDEVV